jgi:hypothetical protein
MGASGVIFSRLPAMSLPKSPLTLATIRTKTKQFRARMIDKDIYVRIYAMIFALMAPFTFLAIGLVCLVKPNFIANWFKSFSQPISGHEGTFLINQQIQERHATSRILFIRILGITFSGVGIWILIQGAVKYFE